MTKMQIKNSLKSIRSRFRLSRIINRLPWRFAIRRFARAHGFLDPMLLLEQLQRFAQPAEVAESTELLRAGAVFHARGLLNVKAIQHNLDWNWPYWVQRQFDPQDPSFIPRAFSITHVNLTHRNWTAVGVPDIDWFPIVDERGLLTPHWDSWSVEIWLLEWREAIQRYHLLKAEEVTQSLDILGNLCVETTSQFAGARVVQKVKMELKEDSVQCVQNIDVLSSQERLFVLALRPYNPEGVSFIDRLTYDAQERLFTVNDSMKLILGAEPKEVLLSEYRHGDVLHAVRKDHHRLKPTSSTEVSCDVGMATAAAVYQVQAETPFTLRIQLPAQTLQTTRTTHHPVSTTQNTSGLAETRWQDSLKGAAELEIPDANLSFLYQAALRTLVLLSPDTMYPGPYTYRRFWCRDAAFISHALIAVGLHRRFPPVIKAFAKTQQANGHFCSQDGEWDSNGQVLWCIARYLLLSQTRLQSNNYAMLEKAAEWIAHKTLPEDASPHAGLLPPGFSAEHLGPNDYYYWDDFWSIAGLEAMAEAFLRENRETAASRFLEIATRLRGNLEKSIGYAIEQNRFSAIPAAPYRRMDAGAIGSLAGDYPCQVLPPSDPRLLATVEYLLDHSCIENAFFQDMIHSGYNAYLTLHIAQVLLRAGDSRAYALLQRVVALASSTGQWPEAIHPHTGGGCMGDGQHAWAASELLLFLRAQFFLEDGDELLLCPAIPEAWCMPGQTLRFGPSPSKFGDIRVIVECTATERTVHWEVEWRYSPKKLLLRAPGALCGQDTETKSPPLELSLHARTHTFSLE